MSKKTRRAGGDKRKSSSQSAWRNHCLLLWLYPSHSQIIDSRISHVLQADLYHAEAIFFYCFCFRKHSESNARGSETKYQYLKKSAEVSLISFMPCGILPVEMKRLVSLTTDGYDF